MKRFVAIFLFLLLVGSSTLYGRPTQIWTYEQLKREADVVVIADALTTEELQEEIDLPNIFVRDDAGQQHPLRAIGLNTTLTVQTVFKGEIEEPTIVVHHFRRKIQPTAEVNGPMLIHFDTKSPGQYLLFLKRAMDGRYEPVSGRIDPFWSVKKLS
jgi:hypothetical protein